MPRERFQLGRYWLSQRSGSPVWYRTWRERGAKRRASLGERDFERAKRALARFVLEEDELRDVRARDMPLDVVLDRYLAAKAGMASRESARYAIERWKRQEPGVMVADVTVTWQERFVDAMRSEGLSEGYIQRIIGVGKAALNRAWKRGEVTAVPFVALPGDGEPYPHHLSRTQLVSLLNAITSPHLWLYAMIRLNTGCRGDAARDLQPFQVDFDAGLVRLNPEGRKQTKKRRPVVPLTQTLRDVLERSGATAHYVSWKGRPVRSVKRAWAQARDAAGLPATFAPRVLRHTFGTEMRRRGVPGWETAGFMGHAGDTHKTTERYAKFDPAYLGKARKAIDAWMVELSRQVPRLRAGASAGPVLHPSGTPIKRKSLIRVVGATGIEPVTPTMSRSRTLRRFKG